MANDEHLHKAFSYFDKDGNGYIEPDELRDALMEDGADDCTNDILKCIKNGGRKRTEDLIHKIKPNK
ncbi:hypothetical protein KY284_035515 [Solanum tuberosum]|nr:hypothetical protein KY284_035515 [Solanum tuberosum]